MSDVDQYAAEAAAIRDRIAGSVETLGERLSPSRLIQDAKDEGMRALLGVRDDGLKAVRGVRDDAARMIGDVRDRGEDMVDDVESFVQENPVAAGAAAAFIGVLLVHNRPRKSRGRSDAAYYDDGDSYTAMASRPASRSRQLLGGVLETVSGARDGLRDRLGAATGKVGETLSDVRSRASATIANAGDRARTGVGSARDQIGASTQAVSETLTAQLDGAQLVARRAANAAAGAIEEQPEAAVAVAAVIGAALALALYGGSASIDRHGG